MNQFSESHNWRPVEANPDLEKGFRLCFIRFTKGNFSHQERLCQHFQDLEKLRNVKGKNLFCFNVLWQGRKKICLNVWILCNLISSAKGQTKLSLCPRKYKYTISRMAAETKNYRKLMLRMNVKNVKMGNFFSASFSMFMGLRTWLSNIFHHK